MNHWELEREKGRPLTSIEHGQMLDALTKLRDEVCATCARRAEYEESGVGDCWWSNFQPYHCRFAADVSEWEGKTK